MVCSYFDDRLAEILSHNHSADLNTIESCQMESSRGQVFQKKKHQCTSYGSFQSPLPTPWHKDAHSPLESRWENTHTQKSQVIPKRWVVFGTLRQNRFTQGKAGKHPQEKYCLPSTISPECVTVQLPAALQIVLMAPVLLQCTVVTTVTTMLL